jgi:hypothetical protein
MLGQGWNGVDARIVLWSQVHKCVRKGTRDACVESNMAVTRKPVSFQSKVKGL